MKKIVTIIDPPEGWKYGFPKPIPSHIMGGKLFTKWLIEQGYPALLIDKQYHKHCRFWNEEIEDNAG